MFDLKELQRGRGACSVLEIGDIMVGKFIRILVGRSIARKHGYSAAAGAAAGLLAPIIVKKIGSLMSKGGSAALKTRRERKAPKYLRHIR